jgi:hypothetical protein
MATVSEKARIIPIQGWDDLQAKLSAYDAGWAFRGMADEHWTLQTSLDRLQTGLNSQAERYLLTAFQRRAHHYIPDPPKLAEDLEWLALMQHHGAPTRLLDCTKSAYVALFFAMSGGEDSGTAALWAVDLDWCKNQAVQRIMPHFAGPLEPTDSLGKPDVFSSAFLSANQAPSLTLVAPMQPFRLNQRLSIQQGLFLCPGNVQLGFELNLLAYEGPQFQDKVHKLSIPRALRIECIRALNKMNINYGTLFPGLDGFARSLGLNVEIATATGRLSQEQQKLSIYNEWSFL